MGQLVAADKRGPAENIVWYCWILWPAESVNVDDSILSLMVMLMLWQQLATMQLMKKAHADDADAADYDDDADDADAVDDDASDAADDADDADAADAQGSGGSSWQLCSW